MTDTVDGLIKHLDNFVNSDDFIYECDEVTEKLLVMKCNNEAIVPILKLFENNEQTDFGLPGPLVHFLEKFYRKGYEEKLQESLLRKPTSCTLWMLNRIINGLKGEEKQNALIFLDSLIASGNMQTETLDEAKHFRSLH